MAQIDFSRIKGIMIDYGGTLDTGGTHWSEVIWQAYLDNGVDVAKPYFLEAYVAGERELATTRHILPEHNFHDMLKIKIDIELQYLAGKGLLPAADVEPKAASIARQCYESARKSIADAKNVLYTLGKKFPLVLVTNFYGNISTVLADFGIADCFKGVVESAVAGVRKPDPDIFRLGLKKLGIKAEEALVIGDSYSKDIKPAEALGCRVLWLKGKGWSAEEDAIQHPNIIKSLREIISACS